MIYPIVELPDLSTKFSPNSVPALTQRVDYFEPSFVKVVDRTTENKSLPVISEWTRTAKPSDTVVLTGWHLSQLKGNKFGGDTEFWVYGQTNRDNGVLLKSQIQQLENNVIKITLPASLPKGSAYLLWAKNSAGYSQPVMINQTEAWWVGPNAATRGQITSIFGRNLSEDGGTKNTNVYLEDTEGNGYWTQVVAVNPYKIDFRVPQKLANGIYKVWVHNGDGGRYNWSKPLLLTINNGLKYTGSVFNVKDFGAVGNGVTDDTQAIQNAIQIASQHNMATVYLPTGKYTVKKTLFLGERKVRWLGDGKDWTTIKAADSFAQDYLFQGEGRNQITFQNLTLDANYKNAKSINTVTHIRFSSDIQYLNVRINAEGTQPFDWHGNNRVFLKNSEVIGKSSFLGTAKQIFIDKTKFFGTNYTDNLLHGFGTRMLSITNSTAQNLDTSSPNNGKWVKGRFFTDQPHWGISQYHYIGGNKTINMAPPPVDGIDRNSGEQIMWEASDTSKFLGVVTAATDKTVSFKNPASVDSNWLLTIVGGKGIGQSRQVKSFDTSNTYQVYEQWNVPPDKSSRIVASKIPSKVVVYNNVLDGTEEAYNSPTHVASAGVQTFLGAADMIIDSNIFHELRAGISLWSGDAQFFKPVYFTQVTNNKFIKNLTGVSFHFSSNPQQTSILGAVISRNFLNEVDTAVDLYPNMNMNVYENNKKGNVADRTNL